MSLTLSTDCFDELTFDSMMGITGDCDRCRGLGLMRIDEHDHRRVFECCTRCDGVGASTVPNDNYALFSLTGRAQVFNLAIECIVEAIPWLKEHFSPEDY